MSKPVIGYDESTFMGRLKHFASLTDPRLLFASEESLREAKEKMESFNTRPYYPREKEEIDDLWRAKYLLSSTYHPDTNEPVLLPFRMSAYVPMNMFIMLGLLSPNPSTKSVVFWQWVNQSWNVGYNWANANKTTKMSANETALAYGSAVTSSVGVAVGLKSIVSNPMLRRFVPFVAVSTAGALNVLLMRRKELVDGIEVKNPEDNVTLGKSQKAGWMAVSQVIYSRILASMPVLTIPPLIMSRLEKRPFFMKYPRLLAPLNFGIIGIVMATALPPAVAAFPQYSVVSVDKLEDRFQTMTYKGKPLQYVTYNKGI